MKIKHLSFKELETYHRSIPMIKKGNKIYQFDNKGFYQSRIVEPFHHDLAQEESVAEWKQILNEETTQIVAMIENGLWIGGSITVTHAPKINMLRNNMENAVLWDIRVDERYQKKGIGSALLEESMKFARKMNCKHLIIETQDNNPLAIDFYMKHGAYLIEAKEHAYTDQMDETQLIFQIDL